MNVKSIAPAIPTEGGNATPNFAKYSQRTQRYEKQITRAPGLDYVVRVPGKAPVKFDGCAVWSPVHELLEAKGPCYANLLKYPFGEDIVEDRGGQAGRQRAVAPTKPIVWHIAEKGAQQAFGPVVATHGVTAKHTPAR